MQWRPVVLFGESPGLQWIFASCYHVLHAALLDIALGGIARNLLVAMLMTAHYDKEKVCFGASSWMQG